MKDDPQRFINRELSLLAFNHRVLKQSQDENVPLLERLKFLCISCTNLDEFFEVRVARLKQKIELGLLNKSIDGLTPAQALKEISTLSHELVRQQYDTLNEQILPALAKEHVNVLTVSQWTDDIRQWVHQTFRSQILPVLTPIGLDPARPFPKVFNKSLNFIVRLQGKDIYKRRTRIAIVRAPRSLPRLIQVPASVGGDGNNFVFLTAVVKQFISEAFPGMDIVSCYQFRVTRNSHLFVDEEEIDDLREALQGQLLDRGYGDAVRLEVGHQSSIEDEEFLREHFALSEDDVYRVNGPVNLNRLITLTALVDRPSLKYRPFVPGALPSKPTDPDIFTTVRRKDVLLHHPYESFTAVVEWLQQAAADPNVVAIKQTLYRTTQESEVVTALCEAARQGKEVTAVIELRARFDEAENIALADQLQEAGAHIVYGVVGYKTHTKMTLIVRREENELVRYVHLGTGNYHPNTARLYTDYGLLTCNSTIGEDVHRLFLQVTGLGQAEQLQLLRQSPFHLHEFLLEKIQFEKEQAEAGKAANIVAKMNALVEPTIIDALYEASQAGVKIDLIVRGICSLRPGVDGLSENIRVVSVIGRFLEHTRVYHFHNAGDKDVYLSSADWMDRNLFRRVETCFPILRPKLKQRVLKELNDYLRDNVGAWKLCKDGQYKKIVDSKKRFSIQEKLLKKYAAWR